MKAVRSNSSSLAPLASRLALVLALAVAWTLPTALTATETPRTSVTVRVYQSAGLPSAFEEEALAEAEIALRAALVDVHWKKCTLVTPSPACADPRTPSELLLRFVRDGAPGRGAHARLGDAVVDGVGGVLATVYFNRVASLANEAKTQTAMLLGRVVAHELGHLIMHSSAHAPRGLMRQHWTPGEVRRNLAADWTFTTADVAAMHRPATE